MPLHRSLLIMTCMLITIPLLAESYSGTKDDPYPLEVFWKKKGDKMAVFCKSKISEETQITDFIFDTDCKESFGKGKNVNFLEQAIATVFSITFPGKANSHTYVVSAGLSL